MAITDTIQRWLADPAPELSFEISAQGLAYAARGGAPRWVPFEEDTLRVSPLEENILRNDSFLKAVREAAGIWGGGGGRERRTTVLILPDFAARMAVLDFSQFPLDPEEQRALVRFRMKKTVPFDVDAAAVSCFVQPRPDGAKEVDVLATLVSLEILAKYEAAFRAAGLWPGRITTSTLAALELVPAAGCRVLIKLSGKVLTVAVTVEGRVRLLRCVELALSEEEGEEPGVSNLAFSTRMARSLERFCDEEEFGRVLYPTLAYLEEELQIRPDSVHLCGLASLPVDVDLPVQTLESPFGTPNPCNAGLLGYLTSGGRS
jgi:type IV pilus assembly protein PilM